MRKLIGIAVVFALLSFVGSAYGAVAVDQKYADAESYVGEATNICFEGQKPSFDGSKVTVLCNGHKDGVTANVSTESNLTSAALSYGVISLASGKTKYVTIANGTPGQMVTIMLPTLVGSYATVVITDDKVSGAVATALLSTGWDDITFDTSLDSITLLYIDDTYGWIIVGNNGCTIT